MAAECPKSPTGKHEWVPGTDSFPERCFWCQTPRKMAESSGQPIPAALARRGAILEESPPPQDQVEDEVNELVQAANERIILQMSQLMGMNQPNPYIASAFTSAYTAIDSADQRRVFVQDFAASLNRRGLLPNDKVEEFTHLGYQLMEAEE